MGIVICVNKNDEIIGKVSMDQAHKEGILHRVSATYLTNDKGEILIQDRVDGGLDHSSAGHVDPGESYLEAAYRELKEELGVSNVRLQEIGKCETDERYINENKHMKHKFMIFECKADPVKLDSNEVKSVFWADPVDVWKDMKKDKGSIKYREGFRATLIIFLESKKLINN